MGHFKLGYTIAVAALLPLAVLAKPAALPGVGQRDKGVPIEVTADTLEVLQQENQAIFSGHVVAIQGKVRLKADKMLVYYSQAPEKIPAASTQPESGAIKRIDATGNVFLSTGEETASGASGTYDVLGNEIHLNDKVVLTRGKNVLKGDKLTYNFASGKSLLTGGAQGKERVRALFVPEDEKKKP